MNIFHIIIPFFFYSFTTKFVTDKQKEKSNYNIVLYFSLIFSTCISYFISDNNLFFEHIFFVCGLTIFFLQSLIKNKYIKYFLEVFVWLSILGIMFYLNLNYIQTISTVIIVIIVCYHLSKSKDIPYTLSLIIPSGILSLYIANNNTLYAILLMTLIGTVRFFIEQTKRKNTEFLTKSFILILLVSIISFNKATTNSNITLIAASFSFIFMDYINRLILRNDKPLIQRLHLTQLLTFINLFKVILFNILVVGIFALAKYELINYYISLAIVVVISFILSLKLWYTEHEKFSN